MILKITAPNGTETHPSKYYPKFNNKCCSLLSIVQKLKDYNIIPNSKPIMNYNADLDQDQDQEEIIDDYFGK